MDSGCVVHAPKHGYEYAFLYVFASISEEWTGGGWGAAGDGWGESFLTEVTVALICAEQCGKICGSCGAYVVPLCVFGKPRRQHRSKCILLSVGGCSLERKVPPSAFMRSSLVSLFSRRTVAAGERVKRREGVVRNACVK